MIGGMYKLWLISAFLFIAASCSGPGTQTGGQVEYQERNWGLVGAPTRLANLEKILKTHTICSGMIDLSSRELHLTVNEPQPWALPKGQVIIRHSSDLWRLRGNKAIGYLNLYLIRLNASGKAVRIARKQMGEDGEMHPDHHDLLKNARPGDLILGMWGF